MDKALNETLASLPDDTKVYVRLATLDTRQCLLTRTPAGPRVHQGQRQVRNQSSAV